MAGRRRADRREQDGDGAVRPLERDAGSDASMNPPQRKVARLQHDAGNRAVVHMGVQRAAMMGLGDKKDEEPKLPTKQAPAGGQTMEFTSGKANTMETKALTFATKASTANQLTKVNVRPYEPGKKKEIVGASHTMAGVTQLGSKQSPANDDKVASVTAEMYLDDVKTKEWK